MLHSIILDDVGPTCRSSLNIGSPTNSYVIQRALALFNYIYYPKVGNSFPKFQYTH